VFRASIAMWVSPRQVSWVGFPIAVMGERQQRVSRGACT